MRNRHRIPFALMLAAVLSGAHAAPRATSNAATQQARKAIQATYNRVNAALAKKDLSVARATRTPDYVLITDKGQKRTAAQLRAQEQGILSLAQSITAKSDIQKITLNGNTATVLVNENGALVVQMPQQNYGGKPSPGQKNVIRVRHQAQDSWVKLNGRWRIKRSRYLTSRVTVNGKPIQQQTSR